MDVSMISDVSVVLLQTQSWGRTGSGSVESAIESVFCFRRSPLSIWASTATIFCFDNRGSEFSEFSGHWIQFNRDSNVLGAWMILKLCYTVLLFWKAGSGIRLWLSLLQTQACLKSLNVWDQRSHQTLRQGEESKAEQLERLLLLFNCLRLLIRYKSYLKIYIIWTFFPQDF